MKKMSIILAVCSFLVLLYSCTQSSAYPFPNRDEPIESVELLYYPFAVDMDNEEFMKFEVIRMLEKEEIHLVTLDDKLNLINCHIVARGGISTVPVNIRKMVQMCIEDNSETIVLAHNHPMGEAKPSVEDIKATKHIMKALKGVGIFLADHIICSPTESYSMYESGFFCFEE